MFPLGDLRITAHALDLLLHVAASPTLFLVRHLRGEWGELPEEDKTANASALINGGRVVSRYFVAVGVYIYVITEADRSATTILLPEEL